MAASQRSAAKTATKSEEQMTLDDYDQEDSGEPAPRREGRGRKPVKDNDEEDTNRPHVTGKKNFGSHTELNLGAGLALGNWSASRTRNALLTLGVQQLLIPAPAYVTVGVNTTFSPVTPRNYMLSANLGGGYMLVKNYTAPFIGFRLGATRLVAHGRGKTFGMTLGPEVGFFPFRVGHHPISLRVQYNWMAARLNDTQPHWATLAFGFIF
jgi:hypothetical protein